LEEKMSRHGVTLGAGDGRKMMKSESVAGEEIAAFFFLLIFLNNQLVSSLLAIK